ncbi:MAG TPA: hypothetical protein VKB11_05025 [Acidimicrobiia bacterium]|nr:hypothetical protein [Acidimicrobiia bacterium]
MSVLDLLMVAVLAVVGVRLFEAARTSVGAHRKTLGVVQGLRSRHFLRAIPIVALIVSTAWALIQLPVLSFGWWSMIGGEGNPVVGVTEKDYGIVSVVVPLFFIGLLIVGMPLLVAREEWVFRRGAEARGTAVNLGRSLVFGLAHAVIGIPIGAALALSIGGLYLTWCYLEGWKETRSQTGALLESTRAHLAYNLTIITLVLVSLVALYASGTA